MATHVELLEDGLRTRVQIPPAPPPLPLKAAKEHHLAAFYLDNLRAGAEVIQLKAA